jgi:acid phosphatase type 7
LDGLSPRTQFFYAVGSSQETLVGGGDCTFITPPRVGRKRPTHIWVLGDSGTANINAQAVRDAYYTFAGTRHTDLWLMLGDNAYNTGLDSEYQAAVFNMYPTTLKQSVLWPTLGNHDSYALWSTGTIPFRDIFHLPTQGESGGVASGSELYYSFDHANIHFVCLDSMMSSREPGGPMLTWLRQDLAETAQDWIIAFWHHPPYTKGSHDSDVEFELIEMRENALPILEEFGVDLVLCGHSHCYERSYLMDGHYGDSSALSSTNILNAGDGRDDGDGAYLKPAGGLGARQGAIYTVAGSSGMASGGSLDHPAMFISLNRLGSLVLDVLSNRLDAVFLQSDGVTGDHFTLLKGDLPEGPRPRLQIAQSGSNVVVSWPTSEPSYLLESTRELPATNSWQTPTNIPARLGRRNLVRLETGGSNQVLRLRKMAP